MSDKRNIYFHEQHISGVLLPIYFLRRQGKSSFFRPVATKTVASSFSIFPLFTASTKLSLFPPFLFFHWEKFCCCPGFCFLPWGGGGCCCNVSLWQFGCLCSPKHVKMTLAFFQLHCSFTNFTFEVVARYRCLLYCAVTRRHIASVCKYNAAFYLEDRGHDKYIGPHGVVINLFLRLESRCFTSHWNSYWNLKLVQHSSPVL